MRGKTKLFIIFAALLPFYAGCTTNPITGKKELMLFPPSQDVAVGRKYAPELQKQMGGQLPDRHIQNYVNSVGQKIAAGNNLHQFQYQYTVLDHNSVNAFALPGGYIFITRAMLEKLDSEAQLAAILAHETAHVVARDTMNVMSNQIGIDLLLSAATTKDTPQAAVTAAQITRQIVGLKYSRDDEKTADIAGLEYMTRTGYNPYGMVETMQMLEQQQQTATIEFLSTHPSPENRVEYLTRRIQTRYNPVGLEIGKQQYQTNVLSRLR